MQFIENIANQIVLFLAAFDPSLIYFLIGILAFLECAAFLGVFVPGETLVVLGGILASNKILEVKVLFIVVFISAFLGDIVGYFWGKKYGLTFFNTVSRAKLVPQEYFVKTREFFDRYGAKTVAIARFVGFLRAVAPFLAGASRTRFAEFLFFDFVGAVGWSAVFVLGGYYLGESFKVVEKYIGRVGLILFLVFFAVVFSRSLLKTARRTMDVFKKRYVSEVLLSLTFLSSAALTYYLGREAREASTGFELSILKIMGNLKSDWLTLFFSLFTAFGSGYFIFIFSLAILVFFITKKRFYDALLFLGSVLAANFLSAILKLIFRTQRPDLPWISFPPSSYSFPSGHTVASAIIFWVVAWIMFRQEKLYFKVLSAVFFSLPLLVGFSRLYFGYHWPIDILGGYTLTFVVFSFWVYFYEKGRLKRKKEDAG